MKFSFSDFSVPHFKLPAFVAPVVGKLPQWPFSITVSTVLNILIRAGVITKDNLDLFENRRFLLKVIDAGSQASFTCRHGVFVPLVASAASPELIFSANLSSFLQIATRQEDPDTLFFNRELSVEGDTELGLVVKNMFDAIEWPKIRGLFPSISIPIVQGVRP